MGNKDSNTKYNKNIKVIDGVINDFSNVGIDNPVQNGNDKNIDGYNNEYSNKVKSLYEKTDMKMLSEKEMFSVYNKKYSHGYLKDEGLNYFSFIYVDQTGNFDLVSKDVLSMYHYINTHKFFH